MRKIVNFNAFVAAIVLAVVASVAADAFLGGPSVSFVPSRRAPSSLDSWRFAELRGGASRAVDNEIEFESSDEEDEDVSHQRVYSTKQVSNENKDTSNFNR